MKLMSSGKEMAELLINQRQTGFAIEFSVIT